MDSTNCQTPVAQLKTNRKLWKYIVFGILTLGIYSIVVMCSVSNSVNTAATRYDGRKTMHYLLMALVFTPLTLGIIPLVWYHKLSGRIGNELQRRGIDYSFGAGDFWLWNILGSLFLVGPWIYCYKLLKATNLMCEDYNING